LNRERVPYTAAVANAVLAFLCAFPGYFGTNGFVAYAAVTSIATIGLYIAYAIPIYLRLRAGDASQPGEWHLDRWYRVIGTIACLWSRSSRSSSSSRRIRTASRGTVASSSRRSSTTRRSRSSAPSCSSELVDAVGRRWFKGPIAQWSEGELAQIEARYGEAATPVATT
jgi:hypothetical protein